jgi:hypothetical protein
MALRKRIEILEKAFAEIDVIEDERNQLTMRALGTIPLEWLYVLRRLAAKDYRIEAEQEQVACDRMHMALERESQHVGFDSHNAFWDWYKRKKSLRHPALQTGTGVTKRASSRSDEGPDPNGNSDLLPSILRTP